MRLNSNKPFFLKSEKKAFVIFIIITIFAIIFSELRFFDRRTQKSIETKVKNKVFHSEISMFANRNLAKKFIKELHIPYPERVDQIIYGNKEYGYYRIKNHIDFNNGKLQLKFIPPGYVFPIEFYVKKDNQNKLIYREKFIPPDSGMLKKIIVQTKGKMSQNFFLLAGIFEPSEFRNKLKSYFVIILNRYGEIVWGHLPSKGKKNFRKYPVIKQVGQGEYAILFGEKWSYFELFNYKGKIQSKIKPENSRIPYVIHHDFILDKEKNKFITFGHSLGNINYQFLNIHHKELASILEKPLSILSNPIIEVDIKRNESKILYEPLFQMPPLFGFDLKNDIDFYKEITKATARHFTRWKSPEAKLDWLHANSIQNTPEGYLVSFRNINKLVMFSHDFKNILWTLGKNKEDTYFVSNPQDQFFHQHHATLLNNGNIILLDNYSGPEKHIKRGSRISILKRDPILGQAHVVWEYTPSHLLNIGNRGSAEVLNNGNVLAFFPNSLKEKDHLIEIDIQRKTPVGHFAIYFSTINKVLTKSQKEFLKKIKKVDHLPPVTRGGGNRAVPIKSIGKEEFIGYEI